MSTNGATAGHNLDNIKSAIKASYDRILEWRDDRSAVQADIQAEREKLVALGIPKKAFDMAVKYAVLDPDERKAFDTAYAIVREAIGLPVQADLFDEIKPPEPKPRGRPPKKQEGKEAAAF